MLDQIQESLKIVPTMSPLFTIRWEINEQESNALN